MHARTETAQARVVSVFDAAPDAHHGVGHDGLESACRLGKIGGMTSLPIIDRLNPEQLRAIAAQLVHRVESIDQKIER